MWLRNATGFPRGTDEGTQSRGKGVVNSAWGWGEGFWGKAVSFLDFVKAILIARSKNPFQRSWDKKGNYYKANRVAHETLWQERQWGLEGAGTHASPSKEGRPEWPGWVRYLPGPLGDGQGVPLSWCHLANMVSEAGLITGRSHYRQVSEKWSCGLGRLLTTHLSPLGGGKYWETAWWLGWS